MGYCGNCGRQFDQTPNFCPDCGHVQSEALHADKRTNEEPEATSVAQDSPGPAAASEGHGLGGSTFGQPDDSVARKRRWQVVIALVAGVVFMMCGLWGVFALAGALVGPDVSDPAAVQAPVVTLVAPDSASASATVQPPVPAPEPVPESDASVEPPYGGHDTAYRKAHSRSTGSIYTPKTGSAERKAIMDAVRANVYYKGKFIVRELHVQGDWAVCTLQTDTKDPYSQEYALRRENGKWVDVFYGDTGETQDWKGMIREAWIDFGVPRSLVVVYKFK